MPDMDRLSSPVSSATVVGTPETAHTSDTLAIDSPKTAARDRGDFARLIPKNDEAKRAFSNIVEMSKLDPDWMAHARQYIYADESQSELFLWHGSDTDEGFESPKIWTGYYRLSLEILPQNPLVGWVIGGGREELPNHGVDLILSLDKRKHRLHGIHARFVHHRESLVFMVFVGPHKTISINGKDIMDDQRQFTSTNTNIVLGLLQYQLEFTLLDEKKYRNQLLRLHRRFSLGENMAPLPDITPSDSHYEYQGFSIQAPIAYGTYGVVSPGTEIATGKAVAVKRLQRTNESLERIKLEISIHKAIGRHPNISQLMSDIYSGGDAFSTGKTSISDVYLIHSPLATDTFYQLTLSVRPFQNRLSAFYQIIRGLAHLHKHGIIHRDIKPTNLMIVSYNPLHAIIIDFGHATFEKYSDDHYKGTIAYLAPEVLVLKNTGHGTLYDNRVDIWALGICGYQLFCKASCDWRKGMQKETSYKKMIEEVEHDPEISGFMTKMVAWDRNDRPSARHLLKLQHWGTVTQDRREQTE